MNLLPVVQRELVEASRKGRVFRARKVAALLATLIAVVMIFFLQLGDGHSLFMVMTWIAFAGCSLSGVFLTADCLRSEKREGTLGLLFLTDLNGYDIIFGKLAMAGCGAAMAVLTLLPIFALSWLLGGVTAGEFWRTALALLLTLGWSLSWGLAVSAFGKNQTSGIGLTLLGIMLFTIVCPAAAHAASMVSGLQAAKTVLDLNPWTCFNGAGYVLYSISPQDFDRAALAVFILILTALAFACWILPRHWTDDRAADEPLEFWKRLAKMPVSGRAPGAALVRSLLDRNPILALEARAPRISVLAWILAIIPVGISVATVFINGAGNFVPIPLTGSGTNSSIPRQYSSTILVNGRIVTNITVVSSNGITTTTRTTPNGSATVTTLSVSPIVVGSKPFSILGSAIGMLCQLGLALLFGWQACGFFCDAKRTGMLEVIATTPLTDLEMLRGQRSALYHLFLVPAVVMSLTSFIDIINAPSPFLAPIQLGGWAFGMATTALAGVTMAWAGAWYGLRNPQRPMAFLKTLGEGYLPTLLCNICAPIVLLFFISALRNRFRFGVRQELVGPRQMFEPMRPPVIPQ